MGKLGRTAEAHRRQTPHWCACRLSLSFVATNLQGREWKDNGKRSAIVRLMSMEVKIVHRQQQHLHMSIALLHNLITYLRPKTVQRGRYRLPNQGL